MRVVGIVAHLPQVNGQRRAVPGVPSSGAPRERSQITFRDMWGL